jgi:hypothetical protein
MTVEKAEPRLGPTSDSRITSCGHDTMVDLPDRLVEILVHAG